MCYDGAASVSYHFRAIRLADAWILHLPGELFVESALAIRAALPGEKILLLCSPMAEYGYVPTAAAHAEGGDEPLFAPLDTGAEERIRSAAVDLMTRSVMETRAARGAIR